jgi:erythromycin esterase-like protein
MPASALRPLIRPLEGSPGDHDPLLDRVGDARLVFLGEASHGTHEFYRERAVITRRLIEEKGFGAVAVEPLERSAAWKRGELPETYPHAV